MALLELAFASKEDWLSVRRFAVREAMSSLFEVSVWARSPDDDIDLASLVGKPASLHLASGLAFALRAARTWSGVCSYMEQEQAEETGLSTYHLRIVPALWLLTQRRNHRIFQHLSAPEIVSRLLDEWRIEAAWHIQREHHPKLESRNYRAVLVVSQGSGYVAAARGALAGLTQDELDQLTRLLH